MRNGRFLSVLVKRKKQKQLAEAIGKTPMLISGIETDKNGPFSDEDLAVISKYMDLSDAEYADLQIRASSARGKLPRHIADYMAGQKEVYSLLEVLANNNMDEDLLKRIKAYAEDIK